MSTKTYSIRFKQIDLLNTSLESPPDEEIENIGNLKYKFNYLVDIRLQSRENSAAVFTSLTILTEADKKLAFIKTVCVFEIPEFQDIFKKTDDNVYQMPIDLEIILKNTSLSTTRGIMFSELRGTYLHNAILPIVDLTTQIKSRHEKSRPSASSTD
jgi:hypothetical protein